MHFVHFTPSIKLVDKNTLWRAVYQYASTRHYEAFGMDLVDRKTLTMIPAVYVTGTDTLYWEKVVVPGRRPRRRHWPVCAAIILPVRYASLVEVLP